MSQLTSKNIISQFTCAGNLMNTNSVSWSQDNAIAIIFSKGVYIFESQFDPSDCSNSFYHKSAIDNQTEAMKFDVGIDFNILLNKCNLDEQHLLMLDHTLNAENPNADQFKCYRSAQWSPCTQQGYCLLGLLTLDHRLVIYHKNQSQWDLLTDLSQITKTSQEHQWNSTTLSYSNYKERVYSLATIDFCWANKITSKDDEMTECFLYSGTKNGTIIFWRFSFDPVFKAQIYYKWETNQGQISCMKHFDDYLIVSTINGVAFIICTDFDTNQSPIPLFLWPDQDELVINHIEIKRINEHAFDIILLKNNYIIITRVESKVSLILKTTKTVIGLHQMPATGICQIAKEKFLITSSDGMLTEMTISNNLTITKKEITIEGITQKGMIAFGLASSKNNVLFCVAQMLSVYHDHLFVKEPIQISIVSNVLYENVISILQEQYALPAKSTLKSIKQFQDYLDCFRFYVVSSQYSIPENLLVLAMNDETKIKSWNDLYILQLTRFLARLFESNSQTRIVEIDQIILKDRAHLCEDLILKMYIEKLFHSFKSSTANLTNYQKTSLRNMILWMSIRFSINLKLFNESSPEEVCPLCSKIIKFKGKTSGTCDNNHTFPRCCNSLLLCDIVNHKYEKCVRCLKSLIIKPSIWKQTSICTYCN